MRNVEGVRINCGLTVTDKKYMIYLEIVESVLYVLDLLILFVQVLKVFHLI